MQEKLQLKMWMNEHVFIEKCKILIQFEKEETGSFHKSTFKEDIHPSQYFQMDLPGKHTFKDQSAHVIIITCILMKLTNIIPINSNLFINFTIKRSKHYFLWQRISHGKNWEAGRPQRNQI